MDKYSGIMYCFEFDGTICDCTFSSNFIKRVFKTFNSTVCLNPYIYDIRWTILTNRPKIDKSTIKAYCILNGLSPSDIICFGNRFHYYNPSQYDKLIYFNKVLNADLKVKYTTREVQRIIYVTNDKIECDFLNMNKNGTPIVCCNSLDFQRQFFNNILV